MLKSFNGVGAARLHWLVTVCVGVMLAGCQMDGALIEDSYQPVSVAERYPIKVVKKPVKMGLRSVSGQLSSEQMNALANFASDAQRAGTSRISVKWPSGSKTARGAAQTIKQALVDHGVPESMIVSASYPGGSAEPVQLSFIRNVAVTKECGNWSENLGFTIANEPHKNFGCATRQNIAAMVANPEDFETMRPMSPVAAANRTVVMKVYLDNATAGNFYTLTGSGN